MIDAVKDFRSEMCADPAATPVIICGDLNAVPGERAAGTHG